MTMLKRYEVISAGTRNTRLQILLQVLVLCLLSLGNPLAQAQETRTTYYHNDLLGSTTAATDKDGKILWRRAYYPFGEKRADPAASAEDRVAYTGKLHNDDTGLTYLNARYYDPVIGRFMAIDPVGPLEGGIQHINRYSYGYNNPYRYTDPTGMIGSGGALGFDGREGSFGAVGHEMSRSMSDGAFMDRDGIISIVDQVMAGFTSLGAIQGFVEAYNGEIGWGVAAIGIIPVTRVIRQGGRYGDLVADGVHRHHMPAKQASPLSEADGPAIRMDPADHRRTASYGGGPGSPQQAYRDAQESLINQGRFDDAFSMDIEDIQSKFRNKYDEAILQAIDALP